jgi:hypothetical protein
MREKTKIFSISDIEEFLDPKLEHTWVLLRKETSEESLHLEYLASGEPDEVKFDADKILQLDMGESEVVGFLHNHPSFTAVLSSRDKKTMSAWSICIGKPLLCFIIGTDGLRGYLFNEEDYTEINNFNSEILNQKILKVTREQETT